jgi:hypothetical protein
MKVTVRATEAGTVGSLEKEKPYLQLATDYQEVEFIKEYFGNRPAVQDFDGFLVNTEDGEYSEVYGFSGNIAYTYKTVFKITRTFSESKPKSKSSKPKTKRKSTKTHTSTSMRGVR